MPKPPFFISTPIYYVNDKPHLGTAYSTIAVDVMARYRKLRGHPTFFLTGLDEHGLKLERRATEQGMAPQDFVDSMAPAFKEAWRALGCQTNDFIRTTEPRHKSRVQTLWKRVEAAGDIYLGDYEDWYCVPCELFYTEKALVDGHNCPIHKKPVEKVKEQSYFFKLSEYTDKLLKFYDDHPGFVQPESRFNEVKAFVKEGLRDLSVSRTSFRWGIAVPGNPKHIMYVWFDALANYITALGGPERPGETSYLYDRFWTQRAQGAQASHLVGKDILRFHAVYWPAFLLSAGIEPPSRVYAHGWLTVTGEKMSKTAGNVVSPLPVANIVGADTLRYYLMRDMAFGDDGDFSFENLISRYQSDLANGVGNLLNRIGASFLPKHFEGRVPNLDKSAHHADDDALVALAKRVSDDVAKHLDDFRPHRAIEALWELVFAANKYIDAQAPWTLAKQGNVARLGNVLYHALEALRWVSIMLWPVMPQKARELREQLGLMDLSPTEQLDLWPGAWGGLTGGTPTHATQPLFAKLDDHVLNNLLATMPGHQTKVNPMTQTSSTAQTPIDQAPKDNFIEFEDFTKVEIKLGLVIEAERVEKSDKLLKLQIDLAEAKPRQILSGIGKTYAPEDLVGKRLAVITNLKPRKMMGHESQGMVLAASDDAGLSVLLTDKAITAGARIT